jgi:hypothetical protein
VTGTTAVDADEARRLRDAMTDKLVKQGRITSAAIEAAFRAVPRHAFARPGNSLEDCYHITLRFEDGAPAAPPLPDDILASEPAAAWSGLTIADMTPWSDAYLWLAGFAPASAASTRPAARSWREAARS